MVRLLPHAHVSHDNVAIYKRYVCTYVRMYIPVYILYSIVQIIVGLPVLWQLWKATNRVTWAIVIRAVVFILLGLPVCSGQLPCIRILLLTSKSKVHICFLLRPVATLDNTSMYVCRNVLHQIYYGSATISATSS